MPYFTIFHRSECLILHILDFTLHTSANIHLYVYCYTSYKCFGNYIGFDLRAYCV